MRVSAVPEGRTLNNYFGKQVKVRIEFNCMLRLSR